MLPEMDLELAVVKALLVATGELAAVEDTHKVTSPDNQVVPDLLALFMLGGNDG